MLLRFASPWTTSIPSARCCKNRVRRRGIYLLPNLFTTAALFAGFYAIVQAMNLQLRPGGGRDLRRDGARRAGRARRAADADAKRVRRRVRQPRRHGELRRRAGAHHLRVGAARHGQARLDRRVRLRARAPRCGSRASTRCSTSPTSAGSPACRAPPPRRSSRASSGSSTTTTSTRERSSWWAWAVTLFAGLTMVSNRQVLQLQDDQPEEERAVPRDLPVRAVSSRCCRTSRRSCCSPASSLYALSGYVVSRG